MKVNKFLSESFEWGTMQAGKLYAVPFSTVYSNTIDQIITSYPFGTLKVGIYSNGVGSPATDYPDALVLDLGSPTFSESNEAVFSVNTAFDRDHHWIVCFIDREAPFPSQTVGQNTLKTPSILYDSSARVGGRGLVATHTSSTLPSTYPATSTVIRSDQFTPFFFIGVSDYTASGGGGGGGASGYSGTSGRSGYSGYSGISGFSGYSGLSGYSGSAGTSGFSGAAGATGTSGFSGQSGYSGVSGFSGRSGYSGYSGTAGATGTSGFSGMFGGDSHKYSFDPDTVDSNPPNGALKFDDLTPSNVSEVYISEMNFDNVDVSTWLDAIGTGRIRIVELGDSSIFVDFDVTSVTGGTGYRKLQVDYVTGNGTFNPPFPLMITYTAGRSGYSGFSGGAGANGTSGFSGYSGSTGTSGFSGYSGKSGFSGTNGSTGADGADGMFGGDSQPYQFNADTAATNPGVGMFKFNNVNPALANRIYINTTNEDAVDVTDWIDALDDVSTAAVRGRLRIVQRNDSSKFAVYNITAANGAGAGYIQINVAYVTGNGSFTPADPLMISFAFSGESGFSGSNGSTGTSGFSGYSGRSGYSGFSGASAGTSIPNDEVAYGTGAGLSSVDDFKWQSADGLLYVWGGLRLKITEATTPYTPLNTDYTVKVVDANGGGGVVTLPNITPPLDGQIYQIKNYDPVNIVNVTGTGGQTIDASASVNLNPYDNLTVQADMATNTWMIL